MKGYGHIVGVGLGLLVSALILGGVASKLVDLREEKTCGQIGSINRALSQQEAEKVSFWGSSTIWVHVDPRVIDPILGISTYNYGLDGTFFQQYSGLLKTFAEKSADSIIIVIGLNITSFHPRRELYRPELFTEAVGRAEVLKPIHEIDAKTAWRMANVPFYEFTLYDSEFYQELLGGCESSPMQFSGYHSNRDVEFEIEGPIPYHTIQYYEPYLEHFKASVAELKESGKRPVLVMTPMYRYAKEQVVNYDSFNEVLKSFEGLGVPIINYADSSICSDKTLFVNYLHMNPRGAKIFSENLAYQMLEIFPDLKSNGVGD